MSATIPIEVRFSVAMIIILVFFSALYDLPLSLPEARGAEFVGIHYLVPLLGVLFWTGCAAFGQKRNVFKSLLVAPLCYAAVLLVHFHLKLWAPILNPHVYDDLYWSIDRSLRPLVEMCFAIRRAILPIIPYEANLYMIGFIFLFYCSFCYHAVRTPERFRTIFLAMLFIQGLGALAYLVMPAVGPFLFEPGLNPDITRSQQFMGTLHQHIRSGGGAWLATHQSGVLLTGVGAMPSLHVGSSFVLLWFAIRHARILLPTYVPLFAFIVINAIASRWHYLIDLPAGVALAALSIWLADRCTRAPAQHPTSDAAMPVGVPAIGLA